MRANAKRFALLTLAVALLGCGASPPESLMAAQGDPGDSASLPAVSESDPSSAHESTDPGCAPSNSGLIERPYEPGMRHGRALVEKSIGDGRTVVPTVGAASIEGYLPLSPPADVGGRSRQLIAVMPEIDLLSLVYASGPVDPSMTVDELWQMRGIVINQIVADGDDPALVAMGTLPDRAWSLRVGPNLAALVHGDANSQGVRPFNLVWTDGIRKWTMYGNPEDPNEMVNLARSIYCD